MAVQPGYARAAGPERPLPRRPRFSSGAALVAGVATLLVAMGVGVLIGHYSNNNPARAGAPVQVVTLGGGGAAANTTAASPANAASPSTAKGSKSTRKTVVVHLSPKTVHAAAAAATKVLGASAPKNPTVTVGGSCTAGTSGCQGGKFTGNYFGP